MSQLRAKELGFTTTEERPLNVNTLDGHPLLNYGIHTSTLPPALPSADSSGTMYEWDEELVAVNMIGYDMIRGKS